MATQACLKRRPVSYHLKHNKNHPLAQKSYTPSTCLNYKAFYRQRRHCYLSEIFLSRTLKNRQRSRHTFCFYRKRVLCQLFQCCFKSSSFKQVQIDLLIHSLCLLSCYLRDHMNIFHKLRKVHIH